MMYRLSVRVSFLGDIAILLCLAFGLPALTLWLRITERLVKLFLAELSALQQRSGVGSDICVSK